MGESDQLTANIRQVGILPLLIFEGLVFPE